MKYIKISALLVAIFFVTGLILNNTNAQDAKKDGKTIFVESKCNACHTVTSQTIESKKNEPVDLSNIANKQCIKDGGPDYLKQVLKKEIECKANNKKHPVAFKGEDADYQTLIEWLLTLKSE